MHLGEWENARDDLIAAENTGADIVASFHDEYMNVADFEQRNDLQVPDDIAELLGG